MPSRAGHGGGTYGAWPRGAGLQGRRSWRTAQGRGAHRGDHRSIAWSCLGSIHARSQGNPTPIAHDHVPGYGSLLQQPTCGRCSGAPSAPGDRHPADEGRGHRIPFAPPAPSPLLHQDQRRAAPGVESCHYGPRFGSVVGLMGRAFRSRHVINRGGADGGVIGKYGLITSSHRAR